MEVPPPGVGLFTVMAAVVPEAISEALMTAVSCVAETKVVVRLDPFQRTLEVGTKPLPLTVRTKLEPPAIVEVGLMLVVTGTGLFTVKL